MTHPTTFLPMAAGYASLVGHHRLLLDDRVRTEAFLRAIERVVRPGDRVIDLGTGTGILAMAASRAGASRVWAIEHDPIVRVAARIARENGIENITFLEQHARDVVVPEADVVISECFGPLAVGGSMLRAVTELRERSRASRVIPRAVTIAVAAVEVPAVYEHVAAFARERYGFAWSSAHALATHNVYNTVIEPAAVVCEAALATIELATGCYGGSLDAACGMTAGRAAVVHGFAGWFIAELGGGVALATGPGAPETIWRQVFFPLASPIAVSPGDAIRFHLRCRDGEHFDWTGDVGASAFARSTRYSHP